MKQTGIIMSGEHAKRILDGIKTQTRRTKGLNNINAYPDNWTVDLQGDIAAFRHKFTGADILIRCPYGQVGSRLWVRETFTKRTDGVDQILFKAQYDELVEMFADSDNDRPEWLPKPPAFPKLKWNPSIHMFRKDSRITLEITEVRVEKVRDITEADAEAEGVEAIYTEPEEIIWFAPAFAKLWDSLNAKKYPWSSNPWVWVLSFKKVEGGDAYQK